MVEAFYIEGIIVVLCVSHGHYLRHIIMIPHPLFYQKYPPEIWTVSLALELQN